MIIVVITMVYGNTLKGTLTRANIMSVMNLLSSKRITPIALGMILKILSYNNIFSSLIVEIN